MTKIISGIQQIGIGVSDVYEAWEWYRKIFGVDVAIFDEAAEANLMLPYTNNSPQKRHAVLAINVQGGGGFEIWQYKSRTPQPANFEIKLGDLGIFITKIKAENINNAYNHLKDNNVNIISEITKTPSGTSHFYVKDPYNNIFEIEEKIDWNLKLNKPTGGNSGAVLGVSDIDKSIEFYSNILGYDTVVYDKAEVFQDFINLPGGTNKFRRVLLKHSKARQGAFSNLLGESTIELVSVQDRQAEKIYKDRLWGDLGFIHLCFDINGMVDIREECKNMGHPFTVDSSNSFDMGEAAGHFSYIEDPDGTLIEFVETHKIPILKKINWYLNLQKRDITKSLPTWFFKVINLTRKKD
jgi:catechol 2,3-dioxygenase-like lactoylglutathione lyase family enzyme